MLTLALLSLLSTDAAAEPPEDGFGWGALPAVNYSSDTGFGYGAIGTGYWYRGGIEPYRTALTLRIYLTTKWVQAHLIRVDSLDVRDLPLRVTGDLGYYSTFTANFCGFADDSNCDPAIAEATADGLALEGEARAACINNFYYLRYTEPYGLVNMRWKLRDKPHRIELMGGYRGSFYMPGTPGDQTPYAGSLLQTAYYPDGERGFASVLQGGVMFDNRDNEPAPNSGYWSEVSLRGASKYWGSDWDYVGLNVTLRGYVTLVPERLVAATRGVFDSTWGDLAIQEAVRVGGSRDYSAVGGEYGGRGMRSWRYIGQVKALGQQEFRLTAFRFTPGDHQINLGFVGFFDYGWAATDWERVADAATGYGTGGGLRVTWNENFIVRVDAGFSPVEEWAPKIYINLDHIF